MGCLSVQSRPLQLSAARPPAPASTCASATRVLRFIREVYVDDLAKELNCQDVLGRTCESVVRITSNDNPPNPKVRYTIRQAKMMEAKYAHL